MYTIRKLRQSDHSQVYRLFCLSIETQFPEYTSGVKAKILTDRRYWSKTSYKSKLHNKNRFMFGVFKKSTLLGLLDADIPFAGVSLGSWLMVDPQNQGKGIGSLLIKRWQKEIKKKGGHMLYLYSPKRNISYYKKIGFSRVGHIRKGFFGLDDYIFSKHIANAKESNFLKN